MSRLFPRLVTWLTAIVTFAIAPVARAGDAQLVLPDLG